MARNFQSISRNLLEVAEIAVIRLGHRESGTFWGIPFVGGSDVTSSDRYLSMFRIFMPKSEQYRYFRAILFDSKGLRWEDTLLQVPDIVAAVIASSPI
ncbi:MAG: hypothetical protein ACTJF3_13820 [Glutamicibacter arilaitensis]|nr:hypothetical protein [Glutamicibacter sp.]